MDISEIYIRIDATDWSRYESAYGGAEHIPVWLKELFGDSRQAALAAAHNLWCSLCHQHAFVSSAALPAYDFLIMGLALLDELIKVEILDILLGFSVCTRVERYQLTGDIPLDWEIELWRRLCSDIGEFEKLAAHKNEDIEYFSEEIVRILNEYQI